MPYEGEFAGYRSLRRIVETERVRQLLGRARTLDPTSLAAGVQPQPAPEQTSALPDFVVVVDGSAAEEPVRTGYPGASIGTAPSPAC